jgi:hypothetical protein
MQQATQSIQAPPQDSGYSYITTTLYELIEEPGQEELVGRIVYDLAEAQKILPPRESFNKTGKLHQNI